MVMHINYTNINYINNRITVKQLKIKK